MCWQPSVFLERPTRVSHPTHEAALIPKLFSRLSTHWLSAGLWQHIWNLHNTEPEHSHDRGTKNDLQPFPQCIEWVTMSSGQTLECMLSSSLPLVLHVWQFAEERVKHVWITKMAKWPFKSAVRTKVWNSWWPWPQAGPQGTSWVLL